MYCRYALANKEKLIKKINGAFRDNVDPFWHEVAKKAAVRGMYGQYTGWEGVNFLHPTSHERGYYAVLKYIAENPGLRHKDICLHYQTRIYTTLSRLRDGGLIIVENRKYLATELGQAYLLGAKNYLCERAEVKHRDYRNLVTGKRVYI